MQSRNPYATKPDFKELAEKYSNFRTYCEFKPDGKVGYKFHETKAIRVLAQTLLQNDFGLNVDIPDDRLAPRVPQRFNYILWIDDLLRENGIVDDIVGIDIGTGSSCIYALLGAKQFGWRFVATDSDISSVEQARKNVSSNNLSDLIEVVHVSSDRLIKDVVRGRPNCRFTFCMCNPPFFDEGELGQKFLPVDESQHIVENTVDTLERCKPPSATVGRTSELSSPGGEVAFIGKLIEDSFILKTSVSVFTSLVGKKSSLLVLKKKLQNKHLEHTVGILSQGKTQRWVLAWTYSSDVKLNKDAKVHAPIILSLPREISSSTFTSTVKELLRDLEIAHSPIKKDTFVCEALKDTWSNQRRKRRTALKAGRSFDGYSRKRHGDAFSAVQTKRPRLCLSKDFSNNAEMGVGDGRDSLSDAGNFNSCDRDRSPYNDAVYDTSVQVYLPSAVEAQSLVRFELSLLPESDSMQLKWICGSRHALHQISQYCRNHLK